MDHLPKLITDLAMILGVAALVSLLFKRLRQPVVLGYIVAGLLVGPNVNLFPTVADINSIRIWADIGVIFLLFGLGLEFSFKKLVELGGSAVITALTGISITMLLGYLLGQSLGWSDMDSLFMGGILAIASTTIIIRAFEELGVKTQKFTNLVTGVLVVEDLVAVVLMVFLSTLAITRTFSGTEMMFSVLKLVFFLILWFVCGIFFLPSLLKALRRQLNEETLLIISLALCFLMVILASSVGFSPALGAFVMGSILAETTKAEKIETLLKPVKNLFGAIFFVSVGMLIDPDMLITYYKPILLSVLVLIFGKPLFVSVGALISGQPLKMAVQSGMSLSQIGEFSFIIATLGVSLNVTSDFLYPVAVAVSVLTTFTTPFMISLSPHVYSGIVRILPENWNQRLNRFSVAAQNVTGMSDWRRLIRFYFINVVVFSVLIITVIILSTRYLQPLFERYNGSREITLVVTLIILAPFLWALAFRRTQTEAYASVWSKPLQRGPLVLLLFSRMVLALFYIGLLFSRLYNPLVAAIGILTTTAILLLFRNRIRIFYSRIEGRFLGNLNERTEGQDYLRTLAPWDTHLSTFELGAYSPLVGRTLQESRIREDYGVNIAMIERGDVTINVPDRDQRIYPNDRLSVIGTDEQLKNFREFIEITKPEAKILQEKQTVGLHHFIIGEKSQLLGKSIRDSGIRQRTKGLVVGIERKGEHILNPESDLVFERDDIVWIVGNEKRIQVLSKAE